jgi:Ca2+/H+ antiporter
VRTSRIPRQTALTRSFLRADHSTYLRRDAKDGADSQLAQLLGAENPEHAPNPKDDSLKGLLKLSRGTSIILLTVYFIYLYFQVRQPRSPHTRKR